MRRLSILLVLALVLTLAGSLVVSAAGTVYVDGTDGSDVSGCGTGTGANACKTIQYAIDNEASAGDTISVAAGTYAERVTIDKDNLTLSGPNAGVDPNTGTRGAEAVIQPTTAGSWPDVGAVSVRNDGVTIDGFEVDGSAASKNGINVYGASSVTVKNNIVHGITNEWDGIGVIVWDWSSASTVDNATIKNNKVYDTGRMGVFCMDYDTTNSEYDLTEGHTITGNTVYDSWQVGWGDHGGGIQINVGKDCSITNNTVYNTQDGNKGIYMFGSGSGNTITGNTVRDNATGIGIWIDGAGGSSIDWEGDTATSPEVYSNNIYDNTDYGAESASMSGYSPMTLDASGNWWGASDPTSVAGVMTGTVDYTPWLASGTDDEPGTAGFQGDFSTLWVDDDSPQAGTTGRIQEGVDEVSGSTVNVAAGTYTETMDVNQSMTIVGAGNDQTFLKSTGSPVVTVSADNVTIQDLEITDDTQLEEGIRVDVGASTGLTVDHVDFTNLGIGSGNAYGINIDNSLTDLSVTNCNFIAMDHTSQSRAIGIFAGNGFNLSSFEVRDSVFERLFVGVYLRSAIDGLDAIGNTFGPFQLSDCTACVSGIYIGDGDDNNFDINNIVVTNNTFTEYGRGVYIWNYAEGGESVSNVEIYENTFSNTIWSSAVRFIAGLGDNEEVSFDGISVHDNTFTQDSDVGAHVSLIDFRTYCELQSCQIDVSDNEMSFTGGVYADPMSGVLILAYEGPFSNTIIADNTLDGGNSGGAGDPPSSGVLLIHKSSEYWPSDTLEADITGNEITGFENGVTVYDDANSVYGGLPTGSSVDMQFNNIHGNALYGIRNDNAETVDAENNWWGDASGPEDTIGTDEVPPCDGDCTDDLNSDGTGDVVTGTVDYCPWLMGVATGTLQAAIDAASPGDVIYLGPYTYEGGIVIDKSVTLQGQEGTVIGPGSSAYTVTASDVKIKDQVIDGDPTDTGNSTDPGILVKADADNLTVENCEVLHWEDGIQVEGDVTSLKLVGNWIHDNTDAGLQVDSGVSVDGNVTIEGNLFKDNGGNGIENGGSDVLTATYNSWGHLDGAKYGDFVSADVITTPFTFAELFLDVEPDTEATHLDVNESESFTVTVKADAEKLYALEFELTYEADKLQFDGMDDDVGFKGSKTCVTNHSISGTVGTITYLCSREDPDTGYDADGGDVLDIGFTATGTGLTGTGPWTTLFDIAHAEADTNAGAEGGIKVYVNNAGFGDPSAPDRDITDTNDGEIEITGIAKFDGFVDLQGRTDDSDATIDVYDQETQSGATRLASGTSAAGGGYTTDYVGSYLLTIGSDYWFQVDAELFLPTTPVTETVYYDSHALDVRPFTTLNQVKLLGGDANDDDEIDVTDATCIGNQYGSSSPGTCDSSGSTDVNGDGVVNLLDLVLMCGNYDLSSSPWTP